MASFFPQTFRDIDVIRLNNITVFNANNTLPSTGSVLTVSSGKAYMLSLTTALEAIGISSLSTQLGGGASNWALFPAISTINVASNPVVGVSGFAFSTCTASGALAMAEGEETTASGLASHAEGYRCQATNNNSHAEGNLTEASGDYAHAEGFQTKATVDAAHAEGSDTTASGDSSHAEGSNTTASADNSHAEGANTTASGDSAHAEGTSCGASGSASHAEGFNTIASGINAHSEGYQTTASGNYSHAANYQTTASGHAAHAVGYGTTASGYASHSEGWSTIASGQATHAEGYFTVATGDYAHSEGQKTTATGIGAHAEGISTLASAAGAHSEGYSTIATALYSHSEGFQTIASGIAAHAEGFSTIASGFYTHAGGQGSAATSTASYAFGISNVASNYGSAIVQGFSNQTAATHQTVMGQFCRPREDNAVAYASGAFLNSTATAFVPGSAQTLLFNIHGTTSTANRYYDLVNFTNSGTSVLSSSRITINAESNAFFMHTIDLTLSGYERKSNTAGGTVGKGTYYGEYIFQVYWDASPSQILYVANGVVSPWSNGQSNTIFASRSFNNLVGGPSIALQVAPVTTATGSNATGYYTIRVASTGVNPINWLAQINVGEVVQNLWSTP